MQFLVFIAYFAGLAVAFAATGGAVYLTFFETLLADDGDAAGLLAVRSIAFAAFLVTGASGAWLARRDRRRWLFSTILFVSVGGTSLASMELTARLWTPPWPARALHGAFPTRSPVPWSGESPGEEPFETNDWGQLDHPRSLDPPDGVTRIALIGDSFLEEASGEPLSVVVERSFERAEVEVVNLGVSATAPDEYYYRLANVALPLGADFCVTCVYVGNDLGIVARTLPSLGGFAAVAPRGSFLDGIGLHGLNHLLTNAARPVTKTWNEAGGLLEHERDLHARFRRSDDAGALELLLQQSPAMTVEQHSMLAERLDDDRMPAFLEMLRQPDAGRFRSYYLSSALWLAGGGRALRNDDVSCDAASFWLLQSSAACRRKGVGFLAVVIPEGFEVDPRMRADWSALADMARLTSPRRAAADRMVRRLRAHGMDVLDLHQALGGVPGTYLNLDGHWSRKGTVLGGEAIGRRLAQRLSD